MKKLAIIGASYLQNPLILRAREMGVETHVFAWEAGDVGERSADFFHPISIVEKEAILDECRRIGIDGITTIGSDLATIPVGYVAARMGLVGNSLDCVAKSTNKSLMRQAFEAGGDPSPGSLTVRSFSELDSNRFAYPLIVKPSDRSGSRGVTKVESSDELEAAVGAALDVSFSGTALVEEFAAGREFSVEFISWHGEHRFLAVTEKITTGAPHFIEQGHFEPARLDNATVENIRHVVGHALCSLGVEYGASHSEVKVDEQGAVKIIEIGARMGGDLIGSDLVRLSTGYDFLKAVIDVALGVEPERLNPEGQPVGFAGVRFVFDRSDIRAFDEMSLRDPDMLVRADVSQPCGATVADSSSRFGYFLFASDSFDKLTRYLPAGGADSASRLPECAS